MTMTLTSPVFPDFGPIPPVYTCEGEDISPPLCWSGVPCGARSLALVVDDPDANGADDGWVHWVLYDIPPDEIGLNGGASSGALPPGAFEGLNDWRHTGWSGPCQPPARHRYRCTLFALDVVLPDLDHPTRAALERAMQGHVLATAELVGTYAKRAA